MRYVMRQKLLSWGDDFVIKDEAGNDVFYVDGKAFSLGDQPSFQERPSRAGVPVEVAASFPDAMLEAGCSCWSRPVEECPAGGPRRRPAGLATSVGRWRAASVA